MSKHIKSYKEHIFDNGLGQMINCYATSGVIPQDNFLLHNYISNVTKKECLRATISQWLMRSFTYAKTHVLLLQINTLS